MQLDPDEVEKSFTNSLRAMAKCLKTFKGLDVVAIPTQLKQEMEDFKPYMPVVTAAASPRFRPAALIDGLLRQRERDAEAAAAPPRPPPPNAAAIFALGRAALPPGVT